MKAKKYDFLECFLSMLLTRYNLKMLTMLWRTHAPTMTK